MSLEGQKATQIAHECLPNPSGSTFVAILFLKNHLKKLFSVYLKTMHTRTMGDLEKEMAAKLWWKQLLENALWCMMSTIFARGLTEINSFSFKSNLLTEIYKHFKISFGTGTAKSDILQKITEMVVKCSCAVEKIVAKETRRRKTTLNRSVCTLPIITHFSSAGSLWIHCRSGKSPA